MKLKIRIALIVKSQKPFVNQIIKICKKRFLNVDIFISDNKKKVPKKLKKNRYDIIISYLSSLILPVAVLKKTKIRKAKVKQTEDNRLARKNILDKMENE